MRERCSKDYVLHRSYWVLKGATREFYICTTAGPSDWRTALCIFDSKAGAGEYLRSLGGPQAFLEIMQSYGMQILGWMRREPQLPEMLPLKRLEELSRRRDTESSEARQPRPDRYGRAG